MPELPEVESAVVRLRAALVGRTIVRVELLHPSLRKVRADARRLVALAGAVVARVERRGKHQLVHLADGRLLLAHFRMNGDWSIERAADPAPRFARARLWLDDDTIVSLVDSRALCTLRVHDAGAHPDLGLGPEPDDEALDVDYLLSAFARRRGAIKPALLDQRVIAGLGNIYAAESLWRARLSPEAPAASLDRRALAALLRAIRAVIRRATGGRYRASTVVGDAPAREPRLDVYDREGQPCRRCRTPIARIVQAGRSTYYCPACQA